MTKIRSTILALALVAAAGSVAEAQNAPTDRAKVERSQRSDSAKQQMRGARRMHAKPPQAVNAALRGIELTDAQRTQVTAIRTKYQDQFKAMRDSAKPAPHAARGGKQSADTAAARAAFSRMQAHRARMEQLMTQQRNEIRGVLTAAQQKTFDQNLTEMQARGERRGRRGGRAGR